MSHSHDEERFPYALQGIADGLREERRALTPLELDRVKRRAMGGAHRSGSSRGASFPLQPRLTSLLTSVFLALGTGGALAALGGGDLGAGAHHGGSAADEQFGQCKASNGFTAENPCQTRPSGQDSSGTGAK
jgi:hypothetical protein